LISNQSLKIFYIKIKYIYLIIEVSNDGILNLELLDFRTSFAENISGTGSISFHR
jgi:hypothetical protein